MISQSHRDSTSGQNIPGLNILPNNDILKSAMSANSNERSGSSFRGNGTIEEGGNFSKRSHRADNSQTIDLSFRK
jgi:hypothetical protein